MRFNTLIAAGIAAIAATASISAAHANDAARFELANTSGRTIDVIQVSPNASPNWGRDLLGDRVLRAGYSVMVTPGPAGCMFDVRVAYHGGGTEEFRNVNLCRIGRISFANTQSYTMN